MEEKATMYFESISIQNFMSFLSKDIEFGKKYNELVGFNGVGKTTILSAINWCLFGKDYNDAKQFSIYPIIGGEERTDLSPSVRLVVNYNGMKFVIRRAIIKSGANNTIAIEVNDQRLKQKEFQVFLKDKLGITEEQFKTLSNISYAVNLPQKELRDLIVGLVGKISDEELFEEESFKDKYEIIKQKILDYGVDAFLRGVNDSIRESEKEILKISGALEQKQKELSEFSFDKEEVTKLLERDAELKGILEDYQAKVLEENEKQTAINVANQTIQKLEFEINSLLKEINFKNIEGKNDKERLMSFMDVETLRRKEISYTQEEIEELNITRKRLESEMSEIQIKKDRNANEFNMLKSKEVVLEETICPMCGREFDQSKIDEMQKKAQELRDKELEELLSKDAKFKEEIEETKKKIEEYNEMINSKNDLIAKIKVKDYTEEISQDEKIVKLQKVLEIKRNEIKEMIARANDMKGQLEVEKHKLTMLPKPKIVPTIETSKSELEVIQIKLANYNIIKKHKEDFEKLKSNKDELDKKVVKQQLLQKLVKQFIQDKSDYMVSKLESCFKYISFKTQEVNKSGDVVDCFKITMSGKQFSSLSAGEKMKASIDLIFGIQKLNNVVVPILIDSIGELDEFPDFVTNQVISCRAVKKPNKNSENYEKAMEVYSKLNVLKGE